jgi:hypothetical protein
MNDRAPRRRLGSTTSQPAPSKAQDPLDTPVAELEIPVRAANTLEGVGKILVRDLTRTTLEELVELKIVGKTFESLKKSLTTRGVYVNGWGMAPPRTRKRKGPSGRKP